MTRRRARFRTRSEARLRRGKAHFWRTKAHVWRARAALAILVPLILVTTALPTRAGDDAVETGEQVYADYCSNCHGEELKNTSGGVTFDLRRLRPEEHERFLNSVLNGKRQMPPWRGALEPDQIEAIWSYIRAKVDQ